MTQARLLFLFLILCCASLLVGARHIAWTQLFALSGALSADAWLTLTASRLPRLAALVLTGVGLSVCGVILQHIVRNKFVEPATSGGLDAAKLGILVSLTVAPAAGTAGKMAFDRIGFLIGPYAAGPYAEGSYDVTLPVTPAVIAAVKPEFRAAFAAGR